MKNIFSNRDGIIAFVLAAIISSTFVYVRWGVKKFKNLSDNIKDWIISFVLAVAVSLVFLSARGMINRQPHDLQLDVDVNVAGSHYSGIMYASVSREDGNIITSGKADVGVLSVNTCSFSAAGKGKHMLNYAGRGMSTDGTELEFTGSITVFPVSGGYRLVRVISTGVSCSSGTSGNIGMGSSQTTSFSTGSTSLLIYDVSIEKDGTGKISSRTFDLPGLPDPEGRWL